MLDGESMIWVGCANEVIILDIRSFGEDLTRSGAIKQRFAVPTHLEGPVVVIAECANVLTGFSCRLLDLRMAGSVIVHKATNVQYPLSCHVRRYQYRGLLSSLSGCESV